MAAVITWCLDLAGLVALCGVAVTPPVCQSLCHPDVLALLRERAKQSECRLTTLSRDVGFASIANCPGCEQHSASRNKNCITTKVDNSSQCSL